MNSTTMPNDGYVDPNYNQYEDQNQGYSDSDHQQYEYEIDDESEGGRNWWPFLAIIPLLLLVGFVLFKVFYWDKLDTDTAALADKEETYASQQAANGANTVGAVANSEESGYNGGESEESGSAYYGMDDEENEGTNKQMAYDDDAEDKSGRYDGRENAQNNGSAYNESSTASNASAARSGNVGNAFPAAPGVPQQYPKMDHAPDGFYSIMNVFREQGNAYKYEEKLKRWNMRTYIFPNDGNYRVGAYLGADIGEAREKLAMVKQNIQRQAWLLQH